MVADVTEGLRAEAERWAQTLVTSEEWLTTATQRPAVWLALVLGHGPEKRSEGTLLTEARARAVTALGGEHQMAKVDGLVTGVIAGRFDVDSALTAL